VLRVHRTTILAGVLYLVACAVAYGGLFSHAYPGDVGTYAGYGRALVHHGRIPYRDFYDEYPPGSVPLFALPALIWDAHYVLVFKLLMTACGLGFTVCASWTVNRLGLSAWRLGPIVLAPVLMGPVFLNRYDPLPAFLVSLALVALLRGQELLPGSLLGVGTALKLYPAVFLPVAVRRVRSVTRAGIAYVAAGAVLFLPFFALAPGGVGFSLWTQAKRHLQIESLGASVLLAGSKLGIHHVGWIRGKPGSIDVGGALADSVGVLSTVLAVALVAAAAWAFWKGPDDDERMVTAWAAAIGAFVIFGKVLSPQYLTWLVPLVPLAAGRRGRQAAILWLAVLAITQLEYLGGGRYGQRDQNWSVWVLLGRNLGLVGVFGLLLGALLDRRQPQAAVGAPPTR
jgi:uncharacterized membrane protein